MAVRTELQATDYWLWTYMCSDTCAFIYVEAVLEMREKSVDYLAASALFFWLDIQLTQVTVVGRWYYLMKFRLAGVCAAQPSLYEMVHLPNPSLSWHRYLHLHVLTSLDLKTWLATQRKYRFFFFPFSPRLPLVLSLCFLCAYELLLSLDYLVFTLDLDNAWGYPKSLKLWKSECLPFISGLLAFLEKAWKLLYLKPCSSFLKLTQICFNLGCHVRCMAVWLFDTPI